MAIRYRIDYTITSQETAQPKRKLKRLKTLNTEDISVEMTPKNSLVSDL